MSMLSAIRTFMLDFPELDADAALLSDHSSGQILQYNIVQQPNSRVLSEDIIGNKECQYTFAFQSIESTMDEAQRHLNSEFYEKLEEWFITQTKLENLPVLKANQTAETIEALTSGYLMQEEAGTGVYQVQCRLLYTEKVT